MKSAGVFLLITSLIAVLALSELSFAADTDGDDSLPGLSEEAGDNDDEESSEEEEDDEKGEGSDDGEGMKTVYSATVSDSQWKEGRCEKEVAIKGPGIDDIIPIACTTENFVFSNNTMLVVGGSLYSDTPGTVVVLKGGRCEKRTYTQTQSNIPPATTRMSPKECATVRKTMADVRRETNSQFTAMTANLQSGLLGSNFGNLPAAGGNTGNSFMNNFGFGL